MESTIPCNPVNPVCNQTDGSHPPKYRALLLFLMTSLYFGASYVYDLPQALQTQLQAEPLNLSYVQFDALYSVYSSPNIFLPFVGGFIINFIGIKVSTLIFTFFVFGGMVLFTVGVSDASYNTMLWGRLIYALGAESLSVAQSIIAVKWFSSKELTLVLGWNNCVCYFGSNLNVALSPLIYALSSKLWLPCIVGTIFCLFSFLAAAVYAIVDGVIHKSRDHSTAEPKFEEHKIKWKDIKMISIVFWFLVLYYMIFYLAFDGVTTNLNDQIHQRFGFTNTVAGYLVLIYYIQLVIVPPIIGRIADKYGKRAHWLMGVGFICMIAQFLMGVLPDQEKNGYIVILPLLLFGFSDGVFETVTWSCLLLSLDPNMTAIGFGFATCAMNTVNVFGMLLIGTIQDATIDNKYGYYWSQMFLVAVSFIAMSLAFVVIIFDHKRGGKLASPLIEDEANYLESRGENNQAKSPEEANLLNIEGEAADTTKQDYTL